MINQLTEYYERAKQKADSKKTALNSFQSIKESFEAEKMNNISDNSAKTLEEFKKEVYNIINSVPITGLAGSQIVINISDKAFEKMMNDEEFMKVQLGALIRDLSWPPTAMYNPAYVVFEIDPTVGYRGTSYGSNYKTAFESKSKNSFWEKRREKSKEIMEENKEYYENKKLKMKYAEMKRLNAQAIAKKIALSKGTPADYKKYMPSLFSAAELLDGFLM